MACCPSSCQIGSAIASVEVIVSTPAFDLEPRDNFLKASGSYAVLRLSSALSDVASSPMTILMLHQAHGAVALRASATKILVLQQKPTPRAI